MRKKVFVIGLDGVGFDLLDPWMKEGELPSLARLFARGLRGELQSTIPPLTGPAWATFQTGVQPGKHGVFGWTRSTTDYHFPVVNANDIDFPTLWQLATDSRRKVVSIGVPMTYPPQHVDGVIVPGMLTPRNDSAPTYPPTAYTELRQISPEYRFFPECAQHLTFNGKLKELLRSVSNRAKVARHFMTNRKWDLFMLHFQATDKVQHDMWDASRKDVDPILTVFQAVDRQIETLVEIAQHNDATIILLSDHGMGPQDFTFSVNTWLMQQGYLRLKAGFSGYLKQLAFKLGLTQRRLINLGWLLYPLAYRLGLVDSFLDIVGNGSIANLISNIFLSLEDVDWSNTTAYSHSDIGHLRINRKGREQEGVVEEKEVRQLVDKLILQLRQVRNPSTDEALLGDVYRKEEIYEGEHLADAPELLFLPHKLRTLACGASGFYSRRLFDRPLSPANHRVEGILAGVGKPFRSSRNIQGACLVDLAPNILYLLGCPIPHYMDGKIWDKAYTPRTIEKNPPVWTEAPPEPPKRAEDRSDDEKLKLRLQSLGYLG